MREGGMVTLPRRVLAKTNKNGPIVVEALGPCWEWTGSTFRTGYGCVNLGGKIITAHLASWLVAGNQRPERGFELCHRCDNRKCVNPSHLFIGTRSDNMRDAVRKGRTVQQAHPERMRRGSRHHNSKLTESQVESIRAKFALGASAQALSAEFGVTDTTISYIVKRKFWRHVA